MYEKFTSIHFYIHLYLYRYLYHITTTLSCIITTFHANMAVTSPEVVFTERNMHSCGHAVPVNAGAEECKEASGGRRKQRTRVRFFFVSSPCDVCLGKPSKATPAAKKVEKTTVKVAPLDAKRQEKQEKMMEKVRLAKEKAQLIREMLNKHANAEMATDGSAEVWSDDIPNLQELLNMVAVSV